MHCENEINEMDVSILQKKIYWWGLKTASLKTASPKTASLKTASLRPFAKHLIKFNKRI